MPRSLYAAAQRTWFPQNPIVQTHATPQAAIWQWIKERPIGQLCILFPSGYDPDGDEAYITIGLSETVTMGELHSVMAPIMEHIIDSGSRSIVILTQSPTNDARYARRNPLDDAKWRWPKDPDLQFAQPDMEELLEENGRLWR